VPHLGGETLESRARQRDRLEQLRVAVPGHHLGGDGLPLEAQPLQHALLVGRLVRGVCAHGTRDRPHRGLGERPLEALRVAMSLEGEARELQAEGRRLGVDAVRAPDAERVAVLAGPLEQRGHQLARAREDPLAGRLELEGEPGVHDVGAGEPEMDPTSRRPGRLGEGVDEGRRLVVGHRLARPDGLERERRAPDRLELFGRRAVELLGGGHLDAAHRLEAGLVGPDASQLGAGVAVDHPSHHRG
jgi:hypothetical protein